MGKRMIKFLILPSMLVMVLVLFPKHVTLAQLPTKNQLQLGTFTPVPTAPLIPTATPVRVVTPTTPTTPRIPIPVTTPKIGGPNGQDYCIDDVDPDMCDDNSSYLVPKGVGGVLGSCGRVIDQAHKLVAALPQYMKGLRDKLERTISTCGYSTGPQDNYVSTMLVIDAYNLAGLKDLSKNNPNHVSPSGLFSWWQSQTGGYIFIPYTPQVVQEYGQGERDLTGCVMFLKTSASYHIGIVNKLEVYNSGGDGVMSILQSGTQMYIDRFPVVAWSIKNTSTNQTTTDGVVGFGCQK